MSMNQILIGCSGWSYPDHYGLPESRNNWNVFPEFGNKGNARSNRIDPDLETDTSPDRIRP